MESNVLHLPPFSIEIDGVEVEVLEVLKTELVSGDTWYHVVVCINYDGIRSRRYSLDVRSMEELVNKLKVEITKIKFIDYAYGRLAVRRWIT